MVTLFGILNIGSRALNAAQSGLNTAGNNVANVNNESYSRQRTVQTSVDPIMFPNGAAGQGVSVVTIERIKDMLLEIQINEATSDKNYSEEFDGIITRIGSIMNDPLTNISDTSNNASNGGLNNLLSNFFDSFHELSNTPEAPEIRAAVVESARTLAESFSIISNNFQVLRSDLNEQVKFYTAEINQKTQEIASLNERIAAIEGGSQVNANDYLDRRDQLVEELAEIVPIKVIDNPNGTINVSIAGQAIVDNVGTTTLQLESVVGKNLDILSIRIGAGGMDVIDDDLRNGKLGAILDARDRLLPSLQDQIDELARGVMYEVNKIHCGSAGVEGYDKVTSNFDFPSGAEEVDSNITLDRIFNNPVQSSRKTISESPYPVQNGIFSIQVADENNKARDVFDVNINIEDTLSDVVERIDRSDGVVSSVRSSLTFDPVYTSKVQGDLGADAVEVTGAIGALAALDGTPIAETVGDYTFDIRLRNPAGSEVDSDPNTDGIDPFTVTINSAMTMQEVAAEIQNAGGGQIRAQLVTSTTDSDITVLRVETIQRGSTISFENDNSGIIEGFEFPVTDPSVPFIGGNATTTQTVFTGDSTDSLLGAGGPNFNTVYAGPPPTVIGEGSFDFVIVDNNDIPVMHTIDIDAAGVNTLDELAAQIEGLDNNIDVEITADKEFIITADNNRSFFFRNDTTGLVEAMGFSEIDGYGKIGDQPFQEGSFEIIVAEENGKVTHIVEVPVIADSSKIGGTFTLNDIVEQINRYTSDYSAPIIASIVSDPSDPSKNQLQIKSEEGFEFTFRSDDSLLLSALGFTDGPVLDATGDNPILGADQTVSIGDSIGGMVRAQIINNDTIEISTTDNDQLSFIGDSSHFLAATGINSLFNGTNALSMEVNQDIEDNSNLLGASKDGSRGNNESALAVAQLQDEIVIDNMTLNEFYRSTVATLGNEGSRTRQFLQTNEDILRELENMREQNSGVSLDEESLDIIRYQQAYQAAARFISTIDNLIDLVVNQIGA